MEGIYIAKARELCDNRPIFLLIPKLPVLEGMEILIVWLTRDERRVVSAFITWHCDQRIALYTVCVLSR